MSWPRDNKDPGTFTSYQGVSDVFNSNLGGDTLACRKRHLSLAGDPNGAAFHCSHATNDSTQICADSLVTVNGNGPYTPYELLRTGKISRRRVGFCDLALDDTIADCTDVGLTDDTFVQALSYLPINVEVIFMSGNKGITMLTDGIFNTPGLTSLQAIYLNDCGITSIDEDALRGLASLKIFNVNMNPIPSLPESLFQYSPGLLQFEYFTTGQGANTALSSLPANLFLNTKSIERIVIYGHKRLTSLPSGLLAGLNNLLIFSMVDCGLTTTGIPANLFVDCTSLEYWDFFGNSIKMFDNVWFSGTGVNWYTNVKRVAMWGQCLTANAYGMLIGPNPFEGMTGLEDAYFHDNGVRIDPAGLLSEANFPNFNSLTFTGSSISGFCPPPVPTPTKMPTTRKPTTKKPTGKPRWY